MQQTGIREGFVSLKRGDKNTITAHGLDILGWGELGKHLIRRSVFVDPDAPVWFLKWCQDHSNTSTKVKVRCTRTVGYDKAYVGPVVDTLEEMTAADAIYVRQRAVEQKEPVDHITSAAFEHHLAVANQNKLEVIENIQDGLKSHTLVQNPLTGKEYKIIGGMLVAKAMLTPGGMSQQQLIKARQYLIRIKPV